jgi:hypothetical protein
VREGALMKSPPSLRDVLGEQLIFDPLISVTNTYTADRSSIRQVREGAQMKTPLSLPDVLDEQLIFDPLISVTIDLYCRQK